MSTLAMDPPPGSARAGVRGRALVVLGLLLLEVPLGAWSIGHAPPGATTAAFWPNAGLSVIALCLAAPRRRPWVYAGIALAALTANLVPGRSFELSSGLAAVAVVEAAAMRAGLTWFGRRAPVLESLEDFLRLVVATLIAAAVGGVGSATLLQLELGLDWTTLLRAVTTSHAAALLTLTPLGLRLPTAHRRGGAGTVEQLVQWTLLVVVTVLVFAPDQPAPVSFLPFPFLIWGAARLQPRLVVCQLVVYGALTGSLSTAGQGPFVAAVEAGDFSPEAIGVLLQANLLASALVALPLSIVRSQQLLALDRLRSQHDMVSNILAATTGTAILGTTLDGRVEFFNVGAERLSGWRADQVEGRASLALLPSPQERVLVTVSEGEPADTSRLVALVEEFLTSSEPSVTADWDFLRADGEVRTISVAISRRYGADGRPVGYLGVADDVTERRRHEAAVVEALATQKQLVDRLAQVDQTKNDFLATVSHELRTPITSILGYSQLLLSDDTGTLPTMHHQVVARIERNGRRLMGLIEDMLTMSQVEVGNVRFHRVPIDLRDPVRNALEVVQPALALRGLTLVDHVGAEAVPVRGDAEKLERVFANLVGNAVKFSHEGGTVEVRLCREGDQAVFRVSDDGIGISPEDQAHLFDRFYRAPQAHALAIQGVGLGLPIAAAIVAGHQGSIEVESELGRGSMFVVRLGLLAGSDAGNSGDSDCGNSGDSDSGDSGDSAGAA